MFRTKKYIFILIGILIIGVIVFACRILYLYYAKDSKPENVIENTLKIKIPINSKIINYKHYKGGYYKAKILVDSKSVRDLKEKLEHYLGGISRQKYPKYFNFKNNCDWWDLKKEDIDVSYNTFASSKKRLFLDSSKSYEIWAFITKKEKEQYYLYIYY